MGGQDGGRDASQFPTGCRRGIKWQLKNYEYQKYPDFDRPPGFTRDYQGLQMVWVL